MPLGNDLLRTITRLDRDRLEKMITVAIDYLDNLDGDPDLENYDVDEEDDDPNFCLAGDDGMHRLRGVDGRNHRTNHRTKRAQMGAQSTAKARTIPHNKHTPPKGGALRLSFGPQTGDADTFLSMN